MGRIKELPKSSSHLLSSTQIITSVPNVVKELIENALDSQATNIEVKLEDYGLDNIEVRDNGMGIHPDDIPFVAKSHCTSKITSHLDLISLQTYGFRGEALAALCTVSNLIITTKTPDAEFGFTYTFNYKGNVLTTKPTPSNQGTTISALNLFTNIPVRRQIFRAEKAKKNELKKVEDILVAFGCIHSGVRFTLSHNHNLIWQKSTVNRTSECLQQIFGRSVADHLKYFEFNDDDSKVNIEGFLPTHDSPLSCSQSSQSRSIIAINKRPVRMKVIDKALKDHFNKLHLDKIKWRYPICYISITVPSSEIDVNFDPNKTAVVMHNTHLIIKQLTKILDTFYKVDLNLEKEITETREPDLNLEKEITESREPDLNTEKEITESRAPDLNLEKEITESRAPDLNLEKEITESRAPLTADLKNENKYISDNTDLSSNINQTSLNTDPNNSRTPLVTVLKTPDTNISSNTDLSSNINQTTLNTDLNTSKTPLLTLLENQNNNKPNNTDSYSNVSLTMLNTEPNNSSLLSKLQKLNTEGRPMFSSKLSRKNMFGTPSTKRMKTNSSTSLIDKHINTINSYLNTSQVGKTDSAGEKRILSNISIPDPIVVGNTQKDLSSVTVRRKSLEGNDFNAHKSVGNMDGTLRTVTPLRQRQLSDSCIDINQSSEGNKNSELRQRNENLKSLSPGLPEWSHGVLPEKMAPPVTVLKPKVVVSNQIRNESPTNKKLNDRTGSPNDRKMTAFDFFCRMHRLEVASLNPFFDNHQIAQVLTKNWNCLSDEEKVEYKEMVKDNISTKNTATLKKNVQENEKTIGSTTDITNKENNEVSNISEEKSIQFNMQLLRQTFPTDQLKRTDDSVLNIIHNVAPGIWICSKNQKIWILNCFRLQEAIVYHRLLETYKLEPEPLESTFLLTSNLLGDDALNIMLHMKTSINKYGNECFIVDDKITANGFQIRVLKDENKSSFEVVGLTKNIAAYDLSDLKEILQLVKQMGISTKLSNCRPNKVASYLQVEAARIAKQSPALNKLEDVEDLCESAISISSEVCVHSKPYLHKLFNLNS